MVTPAGTLAKIGVKSVERAHQSRANRREQETAALAGTNGAKLLAIERTRTRRRLGYIALGTSALLALGAGGVLVFDHETGRAAKFVNGIVNKVIGSSKPGIGVSASASLGTVKFPKTLPLLVGTGANPGSGGEATATFTSQSRFLGHNVPDTQVYSTTRLSQNLALDLPRAGFNAAPTANTAAGHAAVTVTVNPNLLHLYPIDTKLLYQKDHVNAGARLVQFESLGIVSPNTGQHATLSQNIASSMQETLCGPVMDPLVTAGIQTAVREDIKLASSLVPSDGLLAQMARDPITVDYAISSEYPNRPDRTFAQPTIPVPPAITAESIALANGIDPKSVSLDVAKGCTLAPQFVSDAIGMAANQ